VDDQAVELLQLGVDATDPHAQLVAMLDGPREPLAVRGP